MMILKLNDVLWLRITLDDLGDLVYSSDESELTELANDIEHTTRLKYNSPGFGNVVMRIIEEIELIINPVEVNGEIKVPFNREVTY